MLAGRLPNHGEGYWASHVASCVVKALCHRSLLKRSLSITVQGMETNHKPPWGGGEGGEGGRAGEGSGREKEGGRGGGGRVEGGGGGKR